MIGQKRVVGQAVPDEIGGATRRCYFGLVGFWNHRWTQMNTDVRGVFICGSLAVT